MVLKPAYYLADMMTGDFHGVTLPAESVQLRSSLQPGEFSASVDLRKVASTMAEGRAIKDLLMAGKCTLVPIFEGISTGAANPPTSRALGEWWVSRLSGTYRSPVIEIGGPEFSGYSEEVLLTESWLGDALDPVVTTREMLQALYTTSQTIVVDLQSWVSHTGARVPVDAQLSKVNYWSAISDLQNAEGGPFEWMIRTGLELDGWAPRRVTRTLEIGQPKLWLYRPGITLEVSGPGQIPATLLDAGWSLDEARSASTVYGFGAGAGEDQVSASRSRSRVPGEPGKSRMISVRDATSRGELLRHIDAALDRMRPENHVFPGTLPTSRYTPRTGEVYSWRNDESWTMPARTDAEVRCVGWSWRSDGDDVYDLELEEVA